MEWWRQCVCWSLSRVQLFATPWTVGHQAPLFMEFSRQEYWSGWPSPLPGDLPNPGIEPTSLTSPALAAGFFTTSATWEAHRLHSADRKKRKMLLPATMWTASISPSYLE